MKSRISKNFHLPLNSLSSLSSVKTAKSSLPRGHMGGGGGLGVPGVGSRDPRHGLGGPYTRKKFFKPRSKYTHSGHNTQRSFDPPHHAPPKRGTQVRGGGGGTGVNIQKIIRESFLVLK